MIKQALMEGFKNSTYGNKERDGARLLKNDLVSELNYEVDEEKLQIVSSVISENLFNVYSCKIDIDKGSRQVNFTHCTCADFEKKGYLRNGYCCKHLIATFYDFLNKVENDKEIENQLRIISKKEELVRKTEQSILDLLINKDIRKEELVFEIIINRVQWSEKICAEFKIGLKTVKNNKLYSLKDIDGFLLALENRIPINYGKDFTFDITVQKLNVSDKKLIKFLQTLKELDFTSNSYRKFNDRIISGKQATIPKVLVKEFLNIAKNYRVYLGAGFYSRQIETEIITSKLPISMSIKEVGNMLKLDTTNGIPEPLTDMNDAFLCGTDIYLPPDEQVDMIMPYIEAFNHGNTIFFTKDEKDRILRELIPSMQKVSENIDLSANLRQQIVIAPVKFKFYFDKEDAINLTLKVCYDKYEFNYLFDFYEKVIYRDTKKEEEVVNKLRSFGFSIIDNRFYFVAPDDNIFNFFKKDVLELHQYGEVFYSERFTGIKHVGSSIKGHISKGKYEYFDFKFSIKGIPELEIVHILRAFRDNKKYFKLKNGEFLDLEEIEMQQFIKLLDSLEDNENLTNDTISVPKNKGIFIEDYIEDNKIDFIKGRTGLKSLKKSIKDLKSKDFPLPPNINATLREYQKYGYAWLKSLDYMGFGGILGDEMGLGKTLQTITFLASNKRSHTLIVAPTSLLFNWISEFNKFAPGIKVKLLNGDKHDRKDILNNYSKYDVLLTTYNILRRDIDLYENIEFDYCILDEAQNIKNHTSQNAKATKQVNSKNRFALTGTPLENSLMELWSIFDFIMPGYLYSEKKFSARYHRRLEEDDVIIEELNRLIKPFILRRYKKDVLKELPDKIEKKLVVPMTKEQSIAYKTYNDYVKDIIEDKVKFEEFKSSKIEILAYLTKLRQLALDPSVVMEKYEGGSGKIEALIETVKQSIDEGHKILIFSQFTSVLKNVIKEFELNEISYSYLDGNTPSNIRGKLVNDFNQNDTSVFLISLKAGGTGLNLTSADIVIHLDPWWNPAVEDQATDRAHRIGQKKVVEVIKMVSEGTVEEKILMLQDEKRELIDKVVGEGHDLGQVMNKLNEDEIISLFFR